MTSITVRKGSLRSDVEAVNARTPIDGVFVHSARMAEIDTNKTPMWLPTPLYEALPYLYVLGGVLFIGGTLYIGVSHPNAPLYIVCGLVSIVYGALVFGWRQYHRQKADSRQRSDSNA